MSNKKKSLKNSLKNGNLLTGGSVSGLDGNDIIHNIATDQTKTVSLKKLAVQGENSSSALLRVSYTETALGKSVHIDGKDGVTYLTNYITTATPSKYVPNSGENSGILGWVADQIKIATPAPPPVAEPQNIIDNLNTNYFISANTNTNTIIPLGSPLTIGNVNYVNRLLTLQDLMGTLNNDGILSFAPDVQAAIELSPLAQFKHLPSIASLNPQVPSS